MTVHYLGQTADGHVFLVLDRRGERVGTYTGVGTYLEAREDAQEYADGCAYDLRPEQELPFVRKSTPANRGKHDQR